MSALQLLCLAAVATLIGVSQAQCLGRFQPIAPLPRYESFYAGPDDLNALLLLAKALEKQQQPSQPDTKSGEIIDKLLNALIYTTVKCGAGSGGAGGNGGAGGMGGTGGVGSSGGGKVSSGGKKSPLIDLGLLNGDDLLNLGLGGTDLLNLDLGKGGGAVTKLVDGLI